MRQIGVCSWSLRAESAKHLAESVRACGLSAVQLALDPVRTGAAGWSLADVRSHIVDAGITILSGMMGTRGEDYSTLESIRLTGGVRSDEYWPENLAAAVRNAEIAHELGLTLVTFHAGFLPHSEGEGADAALRAVMVDRVRQIADAFDARGVRVALETGQETASTLLEVLREIDRPTVGVNFDPANMILYGMGGPLAALKVLAARVKQVHIKDAKPAEVPGTWGRETPAGSGAVDWQTFIRIVREQTPPGVSLVIERESGEDRIADVRTAAALITRLMSAPASIGERR